MRKLEFKSLIPRTCLSHLSFKISDFLFLDKLFVLDAGSLDLSVDFEVSFQRAELGGESEVFAFEVLDRGVLVVVILFEQQDILLHLFELGLMTGDQVSVLLHELLSTVELRFYVIVLARIVFELFCE